MTSNQSESESNLCSSRRGSNSLPASPSSTSVVSGGGGSLPVDNTIVPYKGKISDLRLILVNFVVAGLEIAASVAFTFIPPLLLKSGYSETQMSIIFGIAPLMALFTVPVIGHWSDVCTSKWGRRRPFIFALSLFLVLSLVLLCIGQNLVADPDRKHNGMYVIAFAVVLLDYASQAAINPCESLMSDMLRSASHPSQSDTGFIIYSAMLSMGSCIGYLLSAVDWQTFSQTTLCSSEQTAILIVLFLFSITLLVTMLTAKERPLKAILMVNGSLPIMNGEATITLDDVLSNEASETKLFIPIPKEVPNFGLMTIKKLCYKFMRPTFIMACIVKAVTNCFLAILKPVRTIYEAPLVLQRLFWADLLCWMAIMAHSMFCTDYVATVIYGGSPFAERGSIEDLRFDEGVRMGSVGLLLHSMTACLFSSFVQDSMANLVGLKTTYVFGLAMFGLSMFFTVVFPSVVVLNVCAAFSGLGFAVATTIPCTLLTKYHEQPHIFFRDTRGSETNAGVGEDMAVLDSTYYLSQIILSLFMGKLVEMTGFPHFYIGIAALCGFLSAILATRVAFTTSDLSIALKN